MDRTSHYEKSQYEKSHYEKSQYEKSHYEKFTLRMVASWFSILATIWSAVVAPDSAEYSQRIIFTRVRKSKFFESYFFRKFWKFSRILEILLEFCKISHDFYVFLFVLGGIDHTS